LDEVAVEEEKKMKQTKKDSGGLLHKYRSPILLIFTLLVLTILTTVTVQAASQPEVIIVGMGTDQAAGAKVQDIYNYLTKIVYFGYNITYVGVSPDNTSTMPNSSQEYIDRNVKAVIWRASGTQNINNMVASRRIALNTSIRDNGVALYYDGGSTQTSFLKAFGLGRVDTNKMHFDLLQLNNTDMIGLTDFNNTLGSISNINNSLLKGSDDSINYALNQTTLLADMKVILWARNTSTLVYYPCMIAYNFSLGKILENQCTEYVMDSNAEGTTGDIIDPLRTRAFLWMAGNETLIPMYSKQYISFRMDDWATGTYMDSENVTLDNISVYTQIFLDYQIPVGVGMLARGINSSLVENTTKILTIPGSYIWLHGTNATTNDGHVNIVTGYTTPEGLRDGVIGGK
jgi:hypothetical protein